MKLQNRETGEIGRLSHIGTDDKLCIMTPDGVAYYYDSLAKLNEEWKDHEESFSTSFYTIVDGEIKYCIFYRERIAGCPSNAWAYLKDDGEERIKQLKEVGLYFETEEEAEKAVEKLKAWKRLKDGGFEFVELRAPNYGSSDIITIKAHCPWNSKNIDDLGLLFGGEE